MKRPMLTRQLTLETPERVDDGAGGYTVVWQPLGQLWAEVTPRTGAEVSGIATPLSRMRFKITTRGAPVGQPSRPRPEQRFRDGTRLFLIDAVSELDAQGRYLICHATEEVAT